MKPDKQELLSLILRPDPGTSLPIPTPEALRRKARSYSVFEKWMRVMETFLPDDLEPELHEYLHYAMMGMVVGFSDRNLSPFLEAHTAIIPPLVDDIRSVYQQIKASGTHYDHEEFIYRAFDYGIHKAYYLDWTLYLSKEMY